MPLTTPPDTIMYLVIAEVVRAEVKFCVLSKISPSAFLLPSNKQAKITRRDARYRHFSSGPLGPGPTASTMTMISHDSCSRQVLYLQLQLHAIGCVYRSAAFMASYDGRIDITAARTSISDNKLEEERETVCTVS